MDIHYLYQIRKKVKTKIKQFEFPIVVAAISQIYFCEAFALIVLNSRWIVSFKVDYFLYTYGTFSIFREPEL